MQTYSERLLWARLRAGLTKNELSALAGVDVETLSNIERGIRESPSVVEGIAKFLSVDSEWLRTGAYSVSPDDAVVAVDLEEWKLRLRVARARVGWTQNDLSMRLAVSKATISRWERSCARGGIKAISEENLPLLCKVLGVTRAWLIDGIVPEIDETPAVRVFDVVQVDALEVERVSLSLISGSPVFGVTYSATESGRIESLPAWVISALGLSAGGLLIMGVSDGSMAPALHEGDSVVVNVSDFALESGAVFALNLSGVLAVRRVVLIGGGKWVAKPESHKWNTALLSDEDITCVIGRVVYRLGSTRI